MYKVLLVDDESWILKGLEGRIGWEGYGFRVVGQAHNGMEALEKILQLKPDVVFTDIRMPKMNGLELIKKVKDMQLNTQFVILSGFADFTYAQKAIHYGAVGYCVKPFEEEEVIAILKKIKNTMSKSVYGMGIRLFELLENDREENQNKIAEIFQEAGLAWSQEGMLLVVSVGSGVLRFPPEVKCLSVTLGVGKNAYFLSFSHKNRIREYIGEYPENIKGIGISNRIADISGIRSAIEETETTACNFYITGQKGIYDVNTLQFKELDGIIVRLDEAIARKDTGKADKLIDMVSGMFHEGLCSIRHAIHMYNMTMFFIFKAESRENSQEQYLSNYEQLMGLFGNIDEMLAYLKEQMVIKLKKHTVPEEAGSDVFKAILRFINDNYNKEISLQSLSKEYFVSPSYITRLFRKELGQTSVEYLSKIRINRACELLKKSNMQIYEISESVGYNDYFYFCRILKKLTGKAPTQFREEA